MGHPWPITPLAASLRLVPYATPPLGLLTGTWRAADVSVDDWKKATAKIARITSSAVAMDSLGANELASGSSLPAFRQ